MKTTKLTQKIALFTTFVIASLVCIGCSENNSILSPVNSNESNQDFIGVIVEAIYTPGNPGSYSFYVRNNMQDTIINDFHVQFDSTLTITSHTPRTGWVTDNSTTDTCKGKVGVRCNEPGREIRPGEYGYPLSNVKLASATFKVSMTFRWQATRNGVVVAQGTGTLP